MTDLRLVANNDLRQRDHRWWRKFIKGRIGHRLDEADYQRKLGNQIEADRNEQEAAKI